jgi:hypothetical protein
VRAAQNTLPPDMVNMLASNTVAVMTTHADQRDAWREELARRRAYFASRGPDWAIEVEFADALLAVIDGGRPVLDAGNPYAGVVGQVAAAVDSPHPPAPSPAGRGGENPESVGDGDSQSGPVSQEEAAQELSRQIMAAYASGGIEGVRALLAGMGVPDDQIAAIIAQIEAALGGGEGE